MPKRLPYDIEELRRLYFDEGLDCDAVAERVGMGTGKTVGDHLKKAGYKLRDAGHRPKDWPVAEILRLYWDEGMSSTEIAPVLKCGATTVRRVLAKNGGLRKRGASTKNRRGQNAPRWQGGRVKSAGGYVLVHMPGHPMAWKSGYVAEHRLVASAALGRPVRSDEDVHHINGIKDDNSPDNLFAMNKADHRKTHAEVVRELMRLRKLLTAMGASGATASA